MRVFILTRSTGGFPSLVLQDLIQQQQITLAGVVISQGIHSNRKKLIRRKLQKTLSIGLMGAINGLRMRSWYNDDPNVLPEQPSLEALCIQHNIPFHVIPNTHAPDQATKDVIRGFNADIGLSLGNDYIASTLFNLPQFGMLNVHHEFLPQFRGAQSIIWQLYEGIAETGYTVHQIAKKIDGGAIFCRKKTPIQFKETLKTTVQHNYSLLKKDSAKALCDLLTSWDQRSEIDVSEETARDYTTPSWTQFQQIKRNFSKLKSAASLQQSQ